MAVHASVCMPDHFHGVIEVQEPMEWSLGDIIQAFKAVCTSQWQRQQGMGASCDRPMSVDMGRAEVPGWPVTGEPYELTADYASDQQQWEQAIQEGCTVIVTPGVSGGEKLMKQECLNKGYPMIHIQKEPIGAFWKPERQRFDACANGTLLILAPWNLDQMGSVVGVPSDSDYSRFHNLNLLAAEICAFDGDARILKCNDVTCYNVNFENFCKMKGEK